MRPLASAAAIGVALLAPRVGNARHEEFTPPPSFALGGTPPAGARPARATPAYLTGSRIAAVDDGALVVDADSGVLALVDATGAGIAELSLARGAGLLAYDAAAHLAYVADRLGDRIVVVRVGAALAPVASWRTPAEPYGIALTPDRRTALVTHVADRLLVAYDTASGREQWRMAIAAEPRGVAISPDGERALVGYLAIGAVDEVSLAQHTALHRALPVLAEQAARAGFAVTFLGNEFAVSVFQRERPVAQNEFDGEVMGHYGGSRFPPISHNLALIGFGGQRRTVAAEISVHLPRALAWDAGRDALYIAGLGSDDIVQVTRASQIDMQAGVVGSVGGSERCGADGLAIAGDGNLLVWCSFTRSVARVTVLGAPGRDGKRSLATAWRVARGPAIAASALEPPQHLGMVLFHTASVHISEFGGLACANCHFEGRADGLSWRILGDRLQTPILAGRIASTAPYKWDGAAKDLPTSLRQTVGRLGGDGLGRRDLAALAAYVEAIPAVRAPTRDAVAVARGQAVFEATGCSNCHEGAMYTDQARHQLAPSQRQMDTPSLRGIAASAPYFHDGSAATLEAVLRERGMVHGMSEPARTLGDRDAADLTAFLESL